jgi:hypothetical protein
MKPAEREAVGHDRLPRGGWPLGRMRDAGARIVYHGGLDWAGVQIANLVVRLYGAVPWRFCSADYGAARGGRALV